MLANFFTQYISESQLMVISVLASFILTFLILKAELPFLPKDQGRPNAVNGELSKGKLRGVGLIITICYAVVSLLFVPLTTEYVIFCILLVATMLSGYLDDASKIPWSDYKKGLIDFILAAVCMFTFVKNNSTVVYFFNISFEINPILYFILGIALIWLSINVVNCSDGVDGLCATLSMITMFSFALIFSSTIGDYGKYSLILIGAVLAYLYFNSSPSSMLMGDAGSRAFGFFIAYLAMKSGHPFSFLLLAAVMIIDGGLGLCKIFLLRFLKIHILKKTRTPIHDEMRKNRGWSDTQVVLRFAIIQIVLAAITVALI